MPNSTKHTVHPGQSVCFWTRKKGDPEKKGMCGKVTEVISPDAIKVVTSNREWTLGINYLIPKDQFNAKYFKEKSTATLTPDKRQEYDASRNAELPQLPPMTEMTPIIEQMGHCLDTFRHIPKKPHDAPQSPRQCITDQANRLVSSLNSFYTIQKPAKVHLLDDRINVGGVAYHGYHLHASEDKSTSDRIYVSLRTDAQKRVVSKKRLLGSILHEWMHHYDMHKLEFKNAYHTIGFFNRINRLYNHLKQPWETVRGDTTN